MLICLGKMKSSNLFNEIHFSFRKSQDHTCHLACLIQVYYSFTFIQIYPRYQIPPQSEYNDKYMNILLCLHTFTNVNRTVGAILSPILIPYFFALLHKELNIPNTKKTNMQVESPMAFRCSISLPFLQWWYIGYYRQHKTQVGDFQACSQVLYIYLLYTHGPKVLIFTHSYSMPAFLGSCLPCLVPCSHLLFLPQKTSTPQDTEDFLHFSALHSDL